MLNYTIFSKTKAVLSDASHPVSYTETLTGGAPLRVNAAIQQQLDRCKHMFDLAILAFNFAEREEKLQVVIFFKVNI